MTPVVQISSPLPQSKEWAFPMLYKKSQIGKMHAWHLRFDGKSLVRQWGYVGGKPQEAPLDLKTNLSGRTLMEQAWLQGKQEYTEKVREGYSLTGQTPAITPIQLSKEWTPGMQCGYPMIVQPKIDGARVCFRRGEDGTLKPESKDTLAYTQLDHVLQEADIMTTYMPPGHDIDSEVWIPGVTFEELMGTLRTTNFKHPQSYKLTCYIFDAAPPLGCNDDYETRHNRIKSAYLSYVSDRKAKGLPPTQLILLNYWIANSPQEVMIFGQMCLSAGYEGVMLRHVCGANSIYRGRRNLCLLKFKETHDEEGLILGVEACKGIQKEVAKLVVRDPRGNTVRVKCKNPLHQQAKTWLNNPSLVVGKLITYKFQNLTNKGVPRHPIGKSIRELNPMSTAYGH